MEVELEKVDKYHVANKLFRYFLFICESMQKKFSQKGDLSKPLSLFEKLTWKEFKERFEVIV